MASDRLQQLYDALEREGPDGPVAQALKSWGNYSPTVYDDGKWFPEAVITYFQGILEIVRAVDPSIPPGLPPHCLHPQWIADFLGVSVEELNWPSVPAPVAIAGSLRNIEAKLDTALGTLPDPGRTATDQQPDFQFRLDGASWSIRFRAGAIREHGTFPKMKGFQYLARLLGSPPNRPIEAIDLMNATDPRVTQVRFSVQQELDDPEIVRKAIERLDDDIVQAEENDDEKKVALLEDQKQQLANYVAGASGLAARRTLGPSDPHDKARKAVRNALDRAWETIVEGKMPECAKFLKHHILPSGSTFYYSPPTPAPDWKV